MAVTTAADLIQPEVFADSVVQQAVASSVMTQVAEVDNTLVGQPGDTIRFPKFGRLQQASDLSETVAIVPQKLSMTDTSATIKEVGTAVEITDTAELTSLGNPGAVARGLIVDSVVEKIDQDLRDAAEVVTTDPASTPIIIGGADGLERLDWETGLTEAIAAFGDKWDPSQVAAFVIHSRQHVSLLRDPNFMSVDKFGQGATILRGQVGAVAGGVPVIISDRATTGAGASGETYNALAVRKGALGLLYKRRAIIETDRDILARTTVVATTAHYAVKRLDDKGVVVIRTRAA